MTVLLVTQPPYTKFLSHIPDFLSKLLFRGGHLGISWAAPSQGTGCSLPWLLCCPSASLPPAPKHSVSPSLVPVSVRQIHHLQSIFLLTEKGRHGDRQIFYLLIYSPDVYNSRGWQRPRPGAWNPGLGLAGGWQDPTS